MFTSNPYFRPRTTTVPGLYRYHAGDVFFPGAGNAVFEPAFQLPIIFYVGHGIPAGYLSPIQKPQLYVGQTARLAGIGGVQAGQMFTQPLNIPNSTDFGQ